MPRVAPTMAEQSRRDCNAIIEKYRIKRGFSEESICKACGFTMRTLHNRRINPDDYKRYELKALVKLLSIPREEVADLL